MTEQVAPTASQAVTKLSGPPHHNLNDWFLSQEAGRQQILTQDKWMLAEAAFQAGRASMQSGVPMAILDSSTDNGVTLTTEGTRRLQELDFVPLFLSAPPPQQVGVPHGWSITEENGRLVIQNLSNGGGYAASEEGDSLASTVLFRLSKALLDAKAPLQQSPAGNPSLKELLRLAGEMNDIGALARGLEHGDAVDLGYSDASMALYPKILRECARVAAEAFNTPQQEQVPDGVWEALQRLIESTAVLGPASREDALTVARYRDRVRFLTTQVAAQHDGVPAVHEARVDYLVGVMRAAMKKWEDNQQDDRPQILALADAVAPLFSRKVQGDSETLARICDALGIAPGSAGREPAILLTNIKNLKRFADLLAAVEREYFMVPGEPSDEPEDEGCEPDDECLLNRWGSSEEEYLKQFKAALAVIYLMHGPVRPELIQRLRIEAQNIKACRQDGCADEPYENLLVELHEALTPPPASGM